MPNPSDKLSEGEGVAGYTPGPWFFRLYEGGADLIQGPEGDDGGSIFEGGFTLANDEENAANARLIAAAPDLAEACRYARDLLLNHHDNAQAQMCVLAMIDAALSRLTPSKE